MTVGSATGIPFGESYTQVFSDEEVSVDSRTERDEEFVDAKDWQSRLASMGTDCSSGPIENSYGDIKTDDDGIRLLQYRLFKEEEKVWMLRKQLDQEEMTRARLRQQTIALEDENERLQTEYATVTDLYAAKEGLYQTAEVKVRQLTKENEHLLAGLHRKISELRTLESQMQETITRLDAKMSGIMAEGIAVVCILARKWKTEELRAELENKSLGHLQLARLSLMQCGGDEAADGDTVDRTANSGEELDAPKGDGERDEVPSQGQAESPSTSEQGGSSVCVPDSGGGTVSEKENETTFQSPTDANRKVSEESVPASSVVTAEGKHPNAAAQDAGAKFKRLPDCGASPLPVSVDGYRRQQTDLRKTLHSGSLTARHLSVGRRRPAGIETDNRATGGISVSQGFRRSIKSAGMNEASAAAGSRPAWGRAPVRRVMSEHFAPLSERRSVRVSGPTATSRQFGDKKQVSSKASPSSSGTNVSAHTTDSFRESVDGTPQNRNLPGASGGSVCPRGTERAPVPGDKIASNREKSLKLAAASSSKGHSAPGSVTGSRTARTVTAHQSSTGPGRVSVGTGLRAPISHRERNSSDGGGSVAARPSSQASSGSVVPSASKMVPADKRTPSETIRKEAATSSDTTDLPPASTGACRSDKAETRISTDVATSSAAAPRDCGFADAVSQALPDQRVAAYSGTSVDSCSNEAPVSLAKARPVPTPCSSSASLVNAAALPTLHSAVQGAVSDRLLSENRSDDTTSRPIDIVSCVSVGSADSRGVPATKGGAQSEGVVRKTAPKLPPVQPSRPSFHHASRISFDSRPRKTGDPADTRRRPLPAPGSETSAAAACTAQGQTEMGCNTSASASDGKACSPASESLLRTVACSPPSRESAKEDGIRRPTETQREATSQVPQFISPSQPSSAALVEECQARRADIRPLSSPSTLQVPAGVATTGPTLNLEGTPHTVPGNPPSCAQEEAVDTGVHLSEEESEAPKKRSKSVVRKRLPSRTARGTTHAVNPKKKTPLKDMRNNMEDGSEVEGMQGDTVATEQLSAAPVSAAVLVPAERRLVEGGEARAVTESRPADAAQLPTPGGGAAPEENMGLDAYRGPAQGISSRAPVEAGLRVGPKDDRGVKAENPFLHGTNAAAAACMYAAPVPMNASAVPERERSTGSAKNAPDISRMTPPNDASGALTYPVSSLGVSAPVPAGLGAARGLPALNIGTCERPMNVVANGNSVHAAAALPAAGGALLRGSTGLMHVRRVEMEGPVISGGERASLPVFPPTSQARPAGNNGQLSWSVGTNVSCPPAHKPLYTRFTISGPDAVEQAYAKPSVVTRPRSGSVDEGKVAHPSAARLDVLPAGWMRSVPANADASANQAQPRNRDGGSDSRVHAPLPQVHAVGERPRVPTHTFTFTPTVDRGAQPGGGIRITERQDGQGRQVTGAAGGTTYKQGSAPSGFIQYGSQQHALLHAFHGQTPQAPCVQKQSSVQMPNQRAPPVHTYRAAPLDRAPTNFVTPQGYAIPQQQPQPFMPFPQQARSQDPAAHWALFQMQQLQRKSWRPMQCPPVHYDNRFPLLTQVHGHCMQPAAPSSHGISGPPAGLN
ncbi:Proteophosphoglycan 5, related [Neospora caninum Liverpool]|uniref:Proteophosphoglycan 5, related n=1 Tax=Neospora caninum (strain Liverpool) TaxID=572307 RepID=F0VGL4_NEOCL|nr:Proteophosphoglycan 5, related [Neospora caninum Liverpool]CBZ52858.1 Proteophosphoglycan 5, related [Neospora caninum Liverpool]CEL66839.1 TPA: Proteophosphoglycan 5, related [Neospora caninum Liverpool]|eukprot:XP_003882890.1 Proteophosphoglycan 5, related [Neospora caninum Liverpool]